MNCVIPGNNLKILGKSLIALSKFGDDLYIVPSEHKLSFRTVNISKTAYASIDFLSSFFIFFKFKNNSEDIVSCKLPTKVLLLIFKNASTLEKHIQNCKINYDLNSDVLILKLNYKQNIVKTHYLRLLDEEDLEIFDYTNRPSPNKIIAASNVLINALNNFHNDIELTFVVNPNKLLVRNYVETELTSYAQMMRTQLCLQNNEFGSYTINEETDIRFSYKQFRAAISFAETFALMVTLDFHSSGKPLIISMKHDVIFESYFILATLRYDNLNNTQSSYESTSQISLETNKRKRTTETIKDKINFKRKINGTIDKYLNKNFTEINESGENSQTVKVNDNFNKNQNDDSNLILNSYDEKAERVKMIVFERCFEPTQILEDFDIICPNSDPEDEGD